jgi:hypothetical protein
MTRNRRVLTAIFVLITVTSTSVLVATAAPTQDPAGAADRWKPATGPLMTKWAKDVTPQNVHREYPRPQMVRDEWMNLNGLWQYAEAKEGEEPPLGRELQGRVLVPFPVESALSGVMKNLERIWYRTTFRVPKGWSGRRVLLHFGAVDWEAMAYINGTLVGRHRGGYDPFTFDITDALSKSGSQELVVGVFDPSDGGDQPRGKQVRKPHGIWYTPSSGIWQTVWLEPVPENHIAELVMTPDVDASSLRLTVNAAGVKTALGVRALVFDAGKQVAEGGGEVGKGLQLPLRSPKLWSPSKPFLYDLRVELLRDGKAVDQVKSYFGMRKIEIARDKQGVNRLMLNGEFVMQVGPLDQGFWPDGLYTAPSDEALKSDLVTMKKLGFTMARKHVKVEPERWYYWADKLGLLIWQDMPSGNNKTAEAKQQFERELQHLVLTHRNHPSIIMWVVFNEGWGQYDTERLTAWVKAMDPSRLVNNASGWTDKDVGDVKDIHNYPTPVSPGPDPRRAAVLGEFGGLGLAVDGHTWRKEHWGYQGMSSREQLTSRYERFLKLVYSMKDTAALCAAVYTQITDVETECNGLMTYDRALVKPDIKRVAAANEGDFSLMPPPPVLKPVVPTSEESGQRWRYTFEKPSDDWFKTNFDDSRWNQGPGGFGSAGTPGAVVRTEWKTKEIWLRRTVDLPPGNFTSLQFRLHHDEDAEIYINGILAGNFGGYSTEYDEYPLTKEGRAALLPGRIVIAVHCRQTEGGQYIDVGLVDVVPK